MSLSEKITEVRLMNWKYVAVEDIKEFIRLLKEEIFKLTQMNGMISPHSVEGWIDKLAGDDLTK